MKKEKLILKCKNGLDTGPSAKLATIATKYESKITLTTRGKTGNAKSMMGLLSLCVLYNAEVEIACDGVDEDEALNEIVEAFNNNFDE